VHLADFDADGRLDVATRRSLEAGDVDADGTLDVVVGQMHTAAAREIRVYYNVNGDGSAWTSQLVDDTGIHNGVLDDVESDGDLDLFGANWTGNPPVDDGDGHVDLADPQCTSAWKRAERRRGCGLLGLEALLLPAALRARRRLSLLRG
jgi:hypothetical protein